MRERIEKVKIWVAKNPEFVAVSAFVGTCVTIVIMNDAHQKKRTKLMIDSDEKFMNTLLNAERDGKRPIRDEFGFLWIAEPFKQ